MDISSVMTKVDVQNRDRCIPPVLDLMVMGRWFASNSAVKTC
jgi:hypothetical protein